MRGGEDGVAMVKEDARNPSLDNDEKISICAKEF